MIMSTSISYHSLSLAATIAILQYLPFSKSSTGRALHDKKYVSHADSTITSSDFAESPSSVTIEVENGVERDAVFRCRHQGRDAVISWLMNGSSSRLYPGAVDSFIRDSNGTRVDTLTIPAIPEYNGTEVVCVANLFDGSPIEVTPPAHLIITGISARTESATYNLLINIIIIMIMLIALLNSGSWTTCFNTYSTHHGTW